MPTATQRSVAWNASLVDKDGTMGVVRSPFSRAVRLPVLETTLPGATWQDRVLAR